MTTIYLVRHAHSDWQPSDRRPLSARGRADARRLAEHFAQTSMAAIYSSPAPRVVETIEYLAHRLQIQQVFVPNLRERELPALTSSEFEAAVEETWREWARPFANGESNAAAQARGVAVVKNLLGRHRDKHVLLATHGTLLALVLNGFDGTFGYDFWRGLTFPDAYELTFTEDSLVGVTRKWEQAA